MKRTRTLAAILLASAAALPGVCVLADAQEPDAQTANAAASAAQPPLVLFDANTPVDKLRIQGVKVERGADGAIAIVNGLDDKWPGVHLEGRWDLAEYDALELRLRSTSDEEITLYCRVDCVNTDIKTVEGAITHTLHLMPGESKVWNVPLPANLNPDVRAKLFAMRGKPGGIKTDDRSNDANRIFDKSAITAIRPFENQNKRGDSWVLESISAVVTDENSPSKSEFLSWTPEQFFPMIDEFGQFKHADWPGKTHSLEELRAQIDVENADLAAHQPTEFDEFGGWKNGPQLEATGAFRVEKIDGVWHMIDPAGRLFWSNGVDCVGHSGGITPVTDREFYFDPAVPTSRTVDSPYVKFLDTSDRSVNNYYADRGTFMTYNFTASNLYKKFGDRYLDAERELAPRRLRSWGLNTIGNWSDMEIAWRAKTPYTATCGTNAPLIEGSTGYWGKFVDPFDTKFPVGIRASLERLRARTADDPYCIGYFVDNEISWGEKGSLSRAALMSPATQAVKLAYVDWLRGKYETIERFNEAWQTDAKSWDAIIAEPFKTPENDAANADSDAFYTVICEKYFAEILAAVREVAPKKLYLGCRFAWTNDLARAAAQKYCDVVSYNFYKREVASFEPVEGVDKPVMIGEFHFGALDRGLFHTGLGPCANQAERAKAYEAYVRSALGNPWIVGAHWFQYGDQPTTGRFDGENYQIGLVDVCDRPYQETVDAMRNVGYNLYQLRKETAKPRQ